ncbi:MAG TPA: plastocyanin/azurin family copper-binding protein [Chloroflexota bacterium]|nr:plastocyanin/azurin family copper-binding protein [Chloroflexota bacterium]
MSGTFRLCVRSLGAALALCLLIPVSGAFAQDADAVVDMQGISFLPKEIHVAPGATVLWTNSSPLGHTVTADDGAFDSGMVDPGATFSQVFDAPGVYQYFCQPHGAAGLVGMSATIVVDDPSAEPAVEMAADAPAPTTIAPRPRDPNDYQPDH